MESDFVKKFSLGINPWIGHDDYRAFFREYGRYISSVYFSLPLGKRYSTRLKYDEGLRTEEQVRNLWAILNSAAHEGIISEVAFNTPMLDRTLVENGVRYMKERMFVPGEIVCLRQFGNCLHEHFPDAAMIYSFNDSLRDPENVPKVFSEAAVGKIWLFSRKKRNELIGLGIMPRLLLNNGCSLWCDGCPGGEHCRKAYLNSVQKWGLEGACARATLFPEDFHRLLAHDPDTGKMKYKLSTRLKNLRSQEYLLKSYILGTDTQELLKTGMQMLPLWCGLAHFSADRGRMSAEVFLKEKEKLSWDRSLTEDDP